MAKYALCVGINDYPGSGSDLAGCVNDAMDWAAGLRARGFSVEVLRDAEAKRDEILAALDQAIDALSYGDLLVFQFSGHGSWIPDQSGDEPDERDEILCPYDIMSEKWISDDDLHEAFSERSRGARIVFLSDSCHSGTVNRFASLGPLTPVKPGDTIPQARRVRFLPPGTFRPPLAVRAAQSAMPPRPQRATAASIASILLAGCQDWEYSYDAWFGGRPNGAFSRAALDALAENPLSYQDWYRGIRRRLPCNEYPQTPAIQGARYQRLWGALEEGR